MIFNYIRCSLTEQKLYFVQLSASSLFRPAVRKNKGTALQSEKSATQFLDFYFLSRLQSSMPCAAFLQVAPPPDDRSLIHAEFHQRYYSIQKITAAPIHRYAVH